MSIEAITRLLQEFGGKAYITPDEGAFRARVINDMAEQLDDRSEDIEETVFDVEIEIESNPVPGNISLVVRAASADFETTINLYAYQLNSRERRAVLKELLTVKRRLEVPFDDKKPKVIIRKRTDNSYDQHIAAQKLDVSSDWLRKMLPCTGYKCSERDDGRKDLDFRYSKEMVDRLSKIKDNMFCREDLEYIADLCCEGDIEWAQDLIKYIKSRGNV
jgi:hypothetical protein